MRITFRREGGLAALPGLDRTVVIETDALTPAEAARWQQLVAASGAWIAVSTSVQTARDVRAYHLTLEEGARRSQLVLRDPLPASVKPLVRALEAELKRR